MNQVHRFLRKSFSKFGTPLSRQALELLEKGDYAGLQKLRTTPSAYTDATSYKKDALVTELFRKCRLPGDDARLKAAATSSFFATERKCKETNIRLSRYQSCTQALQPEDIPVMRFIDAWRKELKRVLGDVSYLLEPRFSQGSTLSDHGIYTTIPDKMSTTPTCYPASAYWWDEAFRFTPQHDKYPNPTRVRGNDFFTVPKDSFKDRGCCVEASMNVSLQLAVGSLIKARYATGYGRRLSHNPLRHQRLARLGSAGRRQLATIDLSNASDTISYGVCQLVLPEDWLVLLNSLRAPLTRVDGRYVRLEKFSSMGNGYTFELETVLFQSLCTVIVGNRREVSCFGDDMIVPSSRSTDVIAALKFFGFEPNVDKTFCEGPFRESCGGDFFNGVPVRAHYMKKLPDEPQHWIALANGLRRADPNLQYFASAWYFCIDQLPSHIRRCRGPKELGDVVVYDPEAMPVFRSYITVTGGVKTTNSPTHFWPIYRPVLHTRRLGIDYSYRVATAAGALGVPSEVSFRNGVKGYKVDFTAAYGRNDFMGWLTVR